MEDSKDLIYLIPYEAYYMDSGAPFCPFILPVVNIVAAIVRTYSRLPARFTTKLFLRFLYLHVLYRKAAFSTHAYWL